MNSLLGRVATDEVFEDGQDVPAVLDDTIEHRAEMRLALAFAVPFGEHGRGDGNVPPKFFRFMSP